MLCRFGSRAGADCSRPGQSRCDEPRGRTRVRSSPSGRPDGPCPGSGGANPVVVQSVNALVAEWQRRGLAAGTIKNRNAHLRWWAKRIDRPGVVPTNGELGIANREYLTGEDKSALLDEARRLVGGGALIPPERNHRQQLKVYESQTREAGLYRMHGRHRSALTRYKEITGWNAPAAGGPPRRMLTGTRRQIDTAARKAIARELGHDRSSILGVYIGS